MELTRLRDMPSWFYRVLVLLGILLALAIVFAPFADAAPKASSSEDCRVVADIAFTVAVLAVEGVDRPRAERIMARIYSAGNAEGERLTKLLIEIAFRDKPDPRAYVHALLRGCLHDGNMDHVLGVDS